MFQNYMILSFLFTFEILNTICSLAYLLVGI